TAARQAAEQAIADQAEQRAQAALTADFADFDGNGEPDAVAEALRAAAPDGELTPAAVEAVSRVTGRPATDVARQLAGPDEAPKASAPFLRDHNLEAIADAPEVAAQRLLAILATRRERIEARLEGRSPYVKPNPAKREQLEAELDFI